MPRDDTVIIEGRAYSWRALIELRRAVRGGQGRARTATHAIQDEGLQAQVRAHYRAVHRARPA